MKLSKRSFDSCERRRLKIGGRSSPLWLEVRDLSCFNGVNTKHGDMVPGRGWKASVFSASWVSPLRLEVRDLSLSNGVNTKHGDMVPRRGLEPPRPKRSLAPEASVSTNFTTWARERNFIGVALNCQYPATTDIVRPAVYNPVLYL